VRAYVVYVSYDGAAEPLGRSQVLGYLLLLAADHDITLISFEKDREGRAQLRAELSAAGIEWVALDYHRRPPVLSTALDVVAGRRALIRAARARRPDVVHVRSYVPALIAVLAARSSGGRLLFDIRGFWADERVEGGLWRAHGLLYRIAKRCERLFFARADAVVTLTSASIPRIRGWMAGRDVPIEVIPTCVDPRRFAATTARPGGPRAVWCGSIGTWYRLDLAIALAAAAGLPLTILTRQTQLARAELAGRAAEVRSVAPLEMAAQLHEGDVGLCLIVSSFSKTASAPTRFAEYLAAGMPVAVTPGVGDLERLVEQHGVGVVVRDEGAAALADAAAQLVRMAADPLVRKRCRALAGEVFDVRNGSARYGALYERLTTR
jgi:glycosyltransferase involved in cell wall biosynthesis